MEKASSRATRRPISTTRYRKLLVAGIAAVSIPVAESGAQICPQVRGREGKSTKLQLGRAQPECTSPTTTSSGGIPACPEVTPSPSDWAMGPKTKIDLQLKSERSGDVSVRLMAAHVGDGASPDPKTLADGTGTLRLTTRLVIEEPQLALHPRITTVPFTLSVPVTITRGKAKLDTTINAMMQDAGLGTLPDCFRGDFTRIELLDPQGAPFAEGTNPLFSEKVGISFGTRG